MIEVYCDGSCTPNPGEMRVAYTWYSTVTECEFNGWVAEAGYGTSNEAEFLAVLKGILSLPSNQDGTQPAVVCTDSELLSKAIAGTYVLRNPKLRLLYQCIENLRASKWVGVRLIPREENLAHKLLEN